MPFFVKLLMLLAIIIIIFAIKKLIKNQDRDINEQVHTPHSNKLSYEERLEKDRIAWEKRKAHIQKERGINSSVHDTVIKNKTPDISSKKYRYSWDDPEYQKAMNKYFGNIEKIKNNSSVLYNLGVIDGSEMDDLIKLCKTNIEEFRTACTYWQKYGEETPPSAPAYERLAIIYERQKEYQKAIDISVVAIKDGLDPTEYNKRIARLVRKSGLEISNDIGDILL